MVSVMILTTITIAPLMGVIVVDHVSIRNFVQNANVKREKVMTLQMQEWGMASAMMNSIL